MPNEGVGCHDWRIDVLDDGQHHPDDGRDVVVTISHRPTRKSISAIVVYYGSDGDTVVSNVVRDDFALATHTTSRLLLKLCRYYVPEIGRYGDCGMIDTVDIAQTLRNLYPNDSEANHVSDLLAVRVRAA